jgi:hypothetical protein
MTDKSVFLAKVEKEGDDLVLLFEPNLLSALGWNEGDVIAFLKEPGSDKIVLTKVKL